MKTLPLLRALALVLLVAICPARATVPSTTCFLQYTLASNPQALPVTFVFQNTGDLLVTDTRSGVPTTLTLNSDYSVGGGAGSTGTVTTIAGGSHGVLVGDKITISRSVPITQTTSFTNTGPLTAAMIGQALDKQTQVSQQINLNGLRSLQFPADESASGIMSLAARKSNVVGFDSSGNLTFYSFVSGAVLPQTVQGTANQVLVNGASGTPTTGAIILTTPQSIGTASTVRFQKLGLGAAVGANNDLYVQHSAGGVTASASLEVGGGLTAAAATDLHPNAFRDSTTFVGSVDADAYASFDAQTVLGGTHAYNHFNGFQARHSYVGTNTLGVMAGFATLNMGATAGTITKLRGFYVADASIGGTAVVGAFDGIYIDQLSATSGATVITAINVAGNNTVSMAGGQLWDSALLAPIVTTSRLDFTFDQATQQGVALKNKNATNTGVYVNFYNSSTVVQGSISQTNSTTTAYNTASDARLKTNLRDFANSGAILDRIKPRTFDWISGVKDARGFVAQELFEAYPDAVTIGGADPKAEPWQVDYSKLTPVLTAEVKDLRRRVAALEALRRTQAFYSAIEALAIAILASFVFIPLLARRR